MPSLGTHASKNKTVQLENEYFQTTKPQELTGGHGVTVSLTTALQEHIRNHPMPEDASEIEIQIAGDGANMFRGISQTTIAYKHVTKRTEGHDTSDFRSLNSPFSNESLVVFTGKEEYTEVEKAMSRVIGELEDLEANKLSVDGKQYTVKQKGGGDLKWINETLGLCPCAHTHCCAYCDQEKSKLFRTDEELADDEVEPLLRTWENIMERAHLPHAGMTFPWVCPSPGCGACFQSPDEMLADPGPQGEKARLQYNRVHKGVIHGRGPLLNIPPKDMVADVLHFSLREVHHTLENTCRCHCNTQEKADRLAAFMKQTVRCYIKVKKTKTKQGVKEDKVPNIIGRECDDTLANARGMMLTVVDENSEHFRLGMAV